MIASSPYYNTSSDELNYQMIDSLLLNHSLSISRSPPHSCNLFARRKFSNCQQDFGWISVASPITVGYCFNFNEQVWSSTKDHFLIRKRLAGVLQFECTGLLDPKKHQLILIIALERFSYSLQYPIVNFNGVFIKSPGIVRNIFVHWL